MASLVITSGENASHYFQLAGRPLSVGRDPARDIQLIDPKVSRKHFMIRNVGDGYYLQPFKSINPVMVNGDVVTELIELSNRDKIQVGDTTLRFFAFNDEERANALEMTKLADRGLRENQTINDRADPK